MVYSVRKFIPNLAGIIAPLVGLTKKEAAKEVAKRWRQEHDQVYTTVKQLLNQAYFSCFSCLFFSFLSLLFRFLFPLFSLFFPFLSLLICSLFLFSN